MSLSYRRVLLAWTAPVACLTALPIGAQAAEPAIAVEIQAGPLDAALMSLATQARLKIMFTQELVAGRRAPAIRGRLTARDALVRLLRGTDIEIHEPAPGVLVLHARTAAMQRSAPGGPTTVVADQLASVAASDSSQAEAEPPITEGAAPGEAFMVSEIVVGSHIRGVRDGASPVVVLTRSDIDRAGHASIADALSAMPQAFGGAASEDSASTGADPNGTNLTRGTGVNLRGLGVNATLVLVNGRRMAGAGYNGDFNDVSSIPMAAVDHADVLLDGASAIYGSDAVGGVVNIALRTKLDGGETYLRGGLATQGGYRQYQFSQALGRQWSNGHVLLAYEYAGHTRLAGVDRDYAGNADLRPLGGADHRRNTYSHPGNILRLNSSGALVPTYAIPGGQNGVGLQPSSFIAGTSNLENQRGAYSVLPHQVRNSVLAAIEQDLGDRVTLSADARYSQREFATRGSAPITNLVVTAANPYFVSPTGAASERIAYSFQNELGGGIVEGRSESLAASLGVDVRLPHGWAANLYGAYAQELGDSKSRNILNTTFLAEAAGVSADSPLTAFSATRDGYFNPYIGQGSNPRAVLDFISAGRDHINSRSETRSINVQADGPVMSLPGGVLRLAVGGQIRHEGLRTGGDVFTSGYAARSRTRRHTDREVRSAFAELNAPLVGADNARPGIQRLELSLAGRIEDYDDVGTTTNPKVGVIWSPIADLALKASYGTSFRAPALPELSTPYTISPTVLPYNGGQTPVLLLSGGNPDLMPETAKSWSTTVEWTPSATPGLRLAATLFEVRFKGRIAAPVLDNVELSLTSAEFAPFRTFVSPATNAADRAKVLALVNDSHAVQTGLYDLDTYGAIVEARNVNTGSLDVRGLDLSGGYQTTVKGDLLSFDGSLSWMMRYARKVTPTSSATQLAGTAGYPADLRARVSATWTHGASATTVGINHLGDSHDEIGRRIEPWTTLDLQIRLQPRSQAFAWRGLTLALNVQNLLDTDPPFYDSPLAIGYDPANADPVGRLVSLQLTKAW